MERVETVSGPGQGQGGSWDLKCMRDSHSDSDDGHFHFLKTQTLLWFSWQYACSVFLTALGGE